MSVLTLGPSIVLGHTFLWEKWGEGGGEGPGILGADLRAVLRSGYVASKDKVTASRSSVA